MLPSSAAAVAFPAIAVSRDVDRRILARRAGRATFGMVLAAAGIGIAADAAARFPVPARTVIAGGWIAALCAVPLSWLAVRIWSTLVDVGRIGDRWLFVSVSAPLAGLALALPLSIHAGVALLVGVGDFNGWVGLSCALVGHAHIALAILSVRRASRLVAGEKALSPSDIFGIVTGISAIPGAVFFLVPPLVVGATGLPFLYLLQLQEEHVAAERRALE